MKKLIGLLAMVLTIGTMSANAQCAGCSKNCENLKCDESASIVPANQKVDKAEVQAYYFHATRRCATCNAVEKVTKETISKKYGEKISFTSINREENKDHNLIKKHKISGQTLLLIKGDKVINLTNTAFMYARNNPEKFADKLTKEIEGLR